MLEQTDDKSMAEKIHIYPRKFWNNTNEKYNRTDTEIVVIDGSFDNKKDVLEFLFNIEWDDKYSMINFIPWHTSNDFTKDDQIEAIRDHNEYISKLTSEVLKIKHPGTTLATAHDGDISFTKWLEGKTYGNLNIFYSAEKIGAVEVLIAYPTSNTKVVDDLIENLPQILEDDFGSTSVTSVFGNPPTIRRVKPKNARSHLAKLKEKMGNPQSNDDDTIPTKKVNTFYGRPPVSAQTITKSYAQVIAPDNHEAQAPAEINQLTTMLNELRKDHNQLKKSLRENDNTKIIAKVDDKIKSMEGRIDSKLKQSKQEWTTQFTNFFEEFKTASKKERDSQKKKDDDFRNELLKAVKGNNVTPSGVDESARGGAR